MEVRKNEKTPPSITRVAVRGFKSIVDKVAIDFAPLSIFAGANSSGKSSIVQPILLLKQTLDAGYDPGPLLLSGPNVNFTSASQLLSRIGREKADTFEIDLWLGGLATHFIYKRTRKSGLELSSLTYDMGRRESIKLSPTSSHAELEEILPKPFKEIHRVLSKDLRVGNEKGPLQAGQLQWAVERERCFLEPQLFAQGADRLIDSPIFPIPFLPNLSGPFAAELKRVIHLPGLRGTPERTYPVTAVESYFPGTFQNYTASVIAQWQRRKDHKKLEGVSKDLGRLGLAWRVFARNIQDAQVEIRVSRLPHRGRVAGDLVSIADVGLGLSQTLPLIVALHAADGGQMVYLEQPEIHLHPMAQTAFAGVLADAVSRGVQVVVETHSALLLLGIQTAVAEKRIAASDVRLHWFARDERGVTSVKTGQLDDSGAFGDWPEDFAETAMKAENRYLNVAETVKAH